MMEEAVQAAEGDAALIAAAPDLLEACEFILHSTSDLSDAAWEMLNEAVNKARGL